MEAEVEKVVPVANYEISFTGHNSMNGVLGRRDYRTRRYGLAGALLII
ncbi:MAG: hypothetical protein U0X39_14690 [Bacteroidales bacterium]